MSQEYMLSGKKALLIVNPKAGRLISQQKADKIISQLDFVGCKTELCFTEYSKHATKLIEENHGKYDVFVCCGGDGTLNETVSGVMRYAKGSPIGYFPSGTTNDFAKTLGLSRSVEKNSEFMKNGLLNSFDVGYLKQQDMYFTYIASFGAFSAVSYATKQDMKNIFGHAAYIFDGIKSIKDIRAYRASVQADGQRIDGDFIFGSVTNTLSVGGVMNFRKDDVCLNDGKFELMLVRTPSSMQQFGEICVSLINKKFDEKNVIFLHASNITFDFDTPVAFTADGEFAAEHTVLDISNIQNGMNVFSPQRHKDK